MKFIFLTILATLFTVSSIAQMKAEQVKMYVIFNTQTCSEPANGVIMCSAPFYNTATTKSIDLYPANFTCNSSSGTTPSQPPEKISTSFKSFLLENNIYDECQASYWKGHWIDLIYGDKRYVGIVTVDKSLISLSSKEGETKTWYTVVVEILDSKRVIAKMSTQFENWNQLPNATLESNPVESGNLQSQVRLSVGPERTLIIDPGTPTNPIESPLPSPSPTLGSSNNKDNYSDSKRSNHLMAQPIWKVEIGNLK